MDGQILALIITTAGGFVTLVFKSMHDMSVAKQRHEQERQDRMEATAQAKVEREDEARLVRERLDATARQQAHLTQVALNEQTATMLKAIAEARAHMATRADLAFNEANDVNTKIQKLHQMQMHLLSILTQLLAPVVVSAPEPKL